MHMCSLVQLVLVVMGVCQIQAPAKLHGRVVVGVGYSLYAEQGCVGGDLKQL